MKQHTNFSWWKRCTTAATCGWRLHALLALLLLLIPPPLRTSACLLRRLLSRQRSPPSLGARLPPAAPRNPSLTNPAPCDPLHAPPTAAKDQWGHLYREARASPPRAIPCPLHLPRAPPHDAHHRVVFPHTTTLTTGAALSLTSVQLPTVPRDARASQETSESLLYGALYTYPGWEGAPFSLF